LLYNILGNFLTLLRQVKIIIFSAT